MYVCTHDLISIVHSKVFAVQATFFSSLSFRCLIQWRFLSFSYSVLFVTISFTKCKERSKTKNRRKEKQMTRKYNIKFEKVDMISFCLGEKFNWSCASLYSYRYVYVRKMLSACLCVCSHFRAHCKLFNRIFYIVAKLFRKNI